MKDIKLLMKKHIEKDIQRENLSFGLRIALKVTKFLGSWQYIIFSNIFIFTWMGVNWILHNKSFDPYPYILLNFILSYAACQQQPFLQMSSNLTEERNRRHMELTLKIAISTKKIIEKVEGIVNNIFNKTNENNNILKEHTVMLNKVNDAINNLTNEIKELKEGDIDEK